MDTNNKTAQTTKAVNDDLDFFFKNIKTTPDLKPDSPGGIFYKSIVYFSRVHLGKSP